MRTILLLFLTLIAIIILGSFLLSKVSSKGFASSAFYSIYLANPTPTVAIRRSQ